MGLFDKIKNILFDDEEIEEKPKRSEEVTKEVDPAPKENPKAEELKKEAFNPVIPEKRKEFVDDFEIPRKKQEVERPIKVEERDIYKSNNTFNFPIDVDDDFELDKMPKRNQNALEFERETRRVDVEKYTIKKTETVEVREKPFKASPVISPVYGIMDKNYKKEDIIVKKKVEITKTQQNNINLDTVRKKAFGTLEDQIESTLDKPYDEFYKKEPIVQNFDKVVEDDDFFEKPINDIDDLLIDANEEKPTNKVEESSLNETFKLDEVIKEMKKSSKDLEDTDTDLFNLIDSMYDDKEN